MADSHFIQNVPVPYMDLQTLWSDRRAPHDNPFGSLPRRSIARGAPGNLHHMVDEIYARGPFDTEARETIQNQRLYTSSRRGQR